MKGVPGLRGLPLDFPPRMDGLPSWLPPSQSAGKLVPISLGTRDSKNLPQTNNLELMTYVSRGNLFLGGHCC